MADKVYSATYSNVPVYEFNCEGNHCMRRRADDWINATHILKVAEYDKPTRTRILEREVQKGVHEKVQGGYGKYQGTWIPLPEGRMLADRNKVLEKMRPIFDFVPGDKTPPPAPKHATAASGKPRMPRGSAQSRRAPARAQAPYMPPPDYDHVNIQMHDHRAVTPEGSMGTESVFDGYDTHPYGSSRKRRRIQQDPEIQAQNAFSMWAEDLMDYFVLDNDDSNAPASIPMPPENANLDAQFDEKGYTALHWAVAMGDLDVVKHLINSGASIDVQSKSGETPLMRSVVFTNIHDKQNMERIASLLIRTVNMQDWAGSTVFHHISNTTVSKKKYQCARYYMDCILNKMAEVLSPDQIERVLNEIDNQGDTAITIAARNGARKCVRSLIGRNAAVDIPNNAGITADQLIVQLNNRRQERARQLSSSPFQSTNPIHAIGGAVQPPNAIPFDPLVPHTSLEGSNEPDETIYKSEPALKLAAHITPTLSAKMRQLAAAIDAEISEKDAELAEAQRVVNMRQAELEQLKRQADELRAKEAEQTAGGSISDESLSAELDAVEAECISMLEADQTGNLRALYQTPISEPPSGPPDESLDEESSINMRLAFARQILGLKDERHELVQQVTSNLARAGLGQGKQQQYKKKLISEALQTPEDELEALLPDIVEELEMGKGLEVIGV
ncbi:hypothetical protein Q7P37_003700 [Cladosporium fusiforme]